MRQTILPMGTFTITGKAQATKKNVVQIQSPGAQTCLVTVLESKNGIAVAHIDSPYIAAETTKLMVDELQEMGKDRIKARIYGGEYNYFSNSTSISNPIYAELNKRKISYTHKDYCLLSHEIINKVVVRLLSAMGGILLLSYLSYEIPLQLNYLLSTLLIFFIAVKILKVALPQKWRPSFFSDNIDVTLDISTGNVQLVKDSIENTKSIFKKLSSNQLQNLSARMSLKPRDERNASQLSLDRIEI